MSEQHSRRVIALGRIAGAYGVKGWVKIISNTSPQENIIDYPVWLIGRHGEWAECKVVSGRVHGKGVVVQLEHVSDRDQAQAMKGTEIAVYRDQLPDPQEGEYYWVDLEGLRVQTESGVDFGHVDHVFETGANDVLVVKGERERLLPFIKGQVIKSVDFQQRLIVVDWDPEF